MDRQRKVGYRGLESTHLFWRVEGWKCLPLLCFLGLHLGIMLAHKWAPYTKGRERLKKETGHSSLVGGSFNK